FQCGVNNATGSALILSPDGSIVKDTFEIDPTPVCGQAWSNASAFKGGFVVRYNAVLYFFHNDGTLWTDGGLPGKVDQNTDPDGKLVDGIGRAVVIADRGRGDGTRTNSHLNSHYVFTAGAINLAAGGGTGN